MFNCLACESMFPDMCDDCMETIEMDCLADAYYDEQMYQEHLGNTRIVIASGDDFPLELMK